MKRKRMGWFELLGESGAIACFITVIVFFSVSTVNGLLGNSYTVTLSTNTFGEHYLEYFLIVFCFICYLCFRHIRFTFHPKNEEV